MPHVKYLFEATIGEILCRLPAKSESLEKLCNRLLKQHKIGNNHQSWFRITSIRDERRQPCRILGSVRDVFNAVSAGGHFCLPLTFKKWEYDASCQIYVSLDDPKGEGSLISGFPRDPLKDRTWRMIVPTLTVFETYPLTPIKPTTGTF